MSRWRLASNAYGIQIAHRYPTLESRAFHLGARPRTKAIISIFKKRSSMKYLIEIYEIGKPGLILKSFLLQFASPVEAAIFADGVIRKGEGYSIEEDN